MIKSKMSPLSGNNEIKSINDTDHVKMSPLSGRTVLAAWSVLHQAPTEQCRFHRRNNVVLSETNRLRKKTKNGLTKFRDQCIIDDNKFVVILNKLLRFVDGYIAILLTWKYLWIYPTRPCTSGRLSIYRWPWGKVTLRRTKDGLFYLVLLVAPGVSRECVSLR